MLSSTQRLTNKTAGIEQILITTSNGMLIIKRKVIYRISIIYVIYFFVIGKLHLMSKITKIDKTVEAHEGNATVGKWSPDGSTLLTG